MNTKRRNLFDFHVERVEHAYQTALDDGVPSPVILLLDCSDEFGKQIACAVAGIAVIEQHTKQAGNDFDPCVIEGVENDVKFRNLLCLSQDASEFLSTPADQGVFYVVIVADNGSSIATHRLP